MLRLTPAEARRMGISVNKKTGRAKIKRKVPAPTVREKDGKLVITIYDIPPSLNDWHGMHWAAKAKVKRQWEDMLITLLRGRRQFQQPVIRIVFHPDTQRERDKDNYTPKFIMDGLKKSGIIRDDSVNAVDLDWDIATEPAEWCRTEIVVWEKGKVT